MENTLLKIQSRKTVLSDDCLILFSVTEIHHGIWRHWKWSCSTCSIFRWENREIRKLKLRHRALLLTVRALTKVSWHPNRSLFQCSSSLGKGAYFIWIAKILGIVTRQSEEKAQGRISESGQNEGKRRQAARTLCWRQGGSQGYV